MQRAFIRVHEPLRTSANLRLQVESATSSPVRVGYLVATCEHCGRHTDDTSYDTGNAQDLPVYPSQQRGGRDV
jgi:hypothetical protein